MILLIWVFFVAGKQSYNVKFTILPTYQVMSGCLYGIKQEDFFVLVDRKQINILIHEYQKIRSI